MDFPTRKGLSNAPRSSKGSVPIKISIRRSIGISRDWTYQQRDDEGSEVEFCVLGQFLHCTIGDLVDPHRCRGKRKESAELKTDREE